MMLVPEKAFFKDFVEKFSRAKAFGVTWLLSHHNPILSATHRSDLFASTVAADPSLIETLTGYLDGGDLQAATIVVSDAVSALKASDPYAFDVLSKHDLEQLHFEAVRAGVASRHGNDADWKAHVRSNVDRMDFDVGRRWAYETRHKTAAAAAAAAEHTKAAP